MYENIIFLYRTIEKYDFFTFSGEHLVVKSIIEDIMNHFSLKGMPKSLGPWTFKKLSDNEILMIKLYCPIPFIIKDKENG